MATVAPFSRLRHGPPQRLSAPPLRRRRRSPLAWIVRTFGFIALGGMTVFLLQNGDIDRQFEDSQHSVSRIGASSTLAGYPTVIDGDTLRLNGHRIRIVGIDAPERHQTCTDASGHPWACGRAATQRLSALISGGRVECTVRGRDRYGRTLAACAAGSVSDLGVAMVREGYAVDYGGYLLAETGARLRQRGLWAGDFERPQDWRRRHRR